MTVQYINNEDGMRQNFIVKEPTAVGEDEKIVFDIATTLQVKVQANGLQFANKQGVVKQPYHQLKVFGMPMGYPWKPASKKAAAIIAFMYKAKMPYTQ